MQLDSPVCGTISLILTMGLGAEHVLLPDRAWYLYISTDCVSQGAMRHVVAPRQCIRTYYGYCSIKIAFKLQVGSSESP